MTEHYKKYGLEIHESDDCLIIRSRFHVFNKINFGVLLIFILSVSLSIVIILFAKSYFEYFLGGLLCLLPLIMAILSFLKQQSDFVKIDSGKIVVRNSLRKSIIPITNNLKVKIKGDTEFVQLKSQIGSGSYFRTIEIFLCSKEKEYRILNFSAGNENSKEINAFASNLAQRIKQRISPL